MNVQRSNGQGNGVDDVRGAVEQLEAELGARDLPNEVVVSAHVLADEPALALTTDGAAKVLAARAVDALERLARLRAGAGAAQAIAAHRALDVGRLAVAALLEPEGAASDLQRAHQGIVGTTGNSYLFVKLAEIAQAAERVWARVDRRDNAVRGLRDAVAVELGADARHQPSDDDLRKLLVRLEKRPPRGVALSGFVARLLLLWRWRGLDDRRPPREQASAIAKAVDRAISHD